jgi:hypothetical protein
MKRWSDLTKGDELYLLVPYVKDDHIYYELQLSNVINVHKYEYVTNIRFKYTQKYTGKRMRVNLSVNINKDMLTYEILGKSDIARGVDAKYGDFIVSQEYNIINVLPKSLLQKEIGIAYQEIEKQQEKIKYLKGMLNEIC